MLHVRILIVVTCIALLLTGCAAAVAASAPVESGPGAHLPLALRKGMEKRIMHEDV